MSVPPAGHSDETLVKAVRTLQGTTTACALGGVTNRMVAEELGRSVPATRDRLIELVEQGDLVRRDDIGERGPCKAFVTPSFYRETATPDPAAGGEV